MIKNYLKIAIRNLWRNRTFSILNIAGLAIGIACAALIFLWVEDELTFNNYFTNKDQLYQVMGNQTYDGKTHTFASLPGKLSNAIKAEVPGIKNAARTTWGERFLFTYQEKSMYGDGLYVDAEFLQMMSFEFVHGSAGSAFNNLYSLVVTASFAKKIFNAIDVVGKNVRLDGNQEYTITAVVKNLPTNARFNRLEWYAPFAVFEKENDWLQNWTNNGVQTFVVLDKAADATAIDKKLHGFVQAKDSGASARPLLLSANDWRLRNEYKDGKQSGGRIKIVNLFSIIAWIILVIACINFMNLSTAKSEKRAKEVGVRKVMGSGKSLLIGQFITEALLTSFIALLLAIGIVALLLPAFNTLVEKQMLLHLFSPAHVIAMLAIGLLCGLIAGSYPAFYLSSFKPVAVLKGLRFNAGGAVFIRKGLVVTQFVISIVLITCTVIIYQQVMHTKNRELGIDKNNLISINQQLINTKQQGDFALRFNSVKNDLKATGVVENVALSNSGAFNIGSNSAGFGWKGKDNNKAILISMNWATPAYVKTMGMQLVAGRDFYQDGSLADSSSIIINETMAKLMVKEPGAAVGELVDRYEGKLTVIGVVKDYVFNNVYTGAVDPVVIFYDAKAENTYNLLVRFKPAQDTKAALAKVEAVIKKYNPSFPFEYSFVDETFNVMFSNENLIGQLAGLFAALAIFISCLGLFGLAAYTAERRIKEIGIRKVLGASIHNLTGLLSKDFLKLVVISCALAFPLAWYFMHGWLQDYQYRISISWWMFALPALLAICIALITVSAQAVKAALANPIKSLRTE
jgi:putative ABC transport system permease protein